MKKRLIAVLAAVFAATVVALGAAATSSQARDGLDWERRPATHHLSAGGLDWEIAPGASTSSRGLDWE